MADWLNLECIIIGQIVDGDKVKAIPMCLDGKIIDDYVYQLEYSPCNQVTQKGYCVFNVSVTKLFPNDKGLIDMGAEGYVGTPLYSKKGIANGILCGISRNKLNIPSDTEKLINIIATRIGNEIEHLNEHEQIRVYEEVKLLRFVKKCYD